MNKGIAMQAMAPRFFKLLLVFLCLFSSNSHAVSNEQIYLACKAFAESGFKQSDDIMGDGVCMGYVMAVYDMGSSYCQLSKQMANEPFAVEMGKLFGFNSDDVSPKAGIQKYVNTVANRPESWNELAYGEILESLKSLSPCK